ncbi:MAG: hypothetical protein QOH68_699 [Nocardioidaceae bacterium]|nr:hypothetical protein [Nocardioidaceae bacterium]
MEGVLDQKLRGQGGLPYASLPGNEHAPVLEESGNGFFVLQYEGVLEERLELLRGSSVHG